MPINQAIILAGGLGTRLRPLTDHVPKPLLNIGGKPLLAYHIDLLRHHGIKNIAVKTFFKNELFENFIKESGYDDIEVIFEGDKTLGTAGFLWRNSPKLQDEILITYGDNLTNINYSNFVDHIKEGSWDFGMAVFLAENISDKGMVVFDGNDRVHSFIEKPQEEMHASKYANAGVYLVRRTTLEAMPFDGKECDFANDLIPALLNGGKVIKVYKMDEILIDIGTTKNLARAENCVRLQRDKFI